MCVGFERNCESFCSFDYSLIHSLKISTAYSNGSYTHRSCSVGVLCLQAWFRVLRSRSKSSGMIYGLLCPGVIFGWTSLAISIASGTESVERYSNVKKETGRTEKTQVRIGIVQTLD